MILVPWQVLTLSSPVPPGEAVLRVAAVTGQPRPRAARSLSDKPFEGVVHGRSFRLWRAASKSSALVIHGEIVAQSRGSLVRLSVRPSLVGAVALGVWLAGALCGALAATVVSLRQGPVPLPVLATWLLPAVGWVFLTTAVRNDGAQLTHLLEVLLDARRVTRGMAPQP
jgi:hypothetical protein